MCMKNPNPELITEGEAKLEVVDVEKEVEAFNPEIRLLLAKIEMTGSLVDAAIYKHEIEKIRLKDKTGRIR